VHFAAPEPEPVAAEKPVEEGDDGDGTTETIDENDPLWKAVLKIANGDRKAALRMLESPDDLEKYPEVVAILEASSAAEAQAEEDWEKNAAAEASVEASAAVVVKEEASASSKSSGVASAPAAGGDDDGAAEDEGAVLDEGDPREHLNLVFIGHVDAGKSTLSGSILYITGQVDARTIERYEREAKQRNRESWFLAFIMDTSEEERAKGKTVEVGRAQFDTSVHRYTILDAPGHKNYVPNMIQGASQADVGVLVISARKGEFETGFEKGGQTREHALLAKTLGVRFLVVVINKMDDPTVNWSQARFDECVNKLKPYLKICGFAIKKDVRFIPISGLAGDNVLNEVSSERCPWWKGLWQSGANSTDVPTLIGTLDSLSISGRDPDGPLRIPCLARYFDRGTIVMGKIESGTVRLDDEIQFLPTRKKAKVEAIYIGETKVRSAKPGENIMLKFSINVDDCQRGYVLSSPLTPCPVATEFKVQLFFVDVLEHRPIFSRGYDCVMHIHTVEVEVTCQQVLSVTDTSGAKLRQPFARLNQICQCILSTPLLTCMDLFDNHPALGRLTLRDEGKTIAIGKILELVR
jgi:peptide chain release factor subunit 3